jgi:hypothetical protein
VFNLILNAFYNKKQKLFQQKILFKKNVNFLHKNVPKTVFYIDKFHSSS